MELILVFILIGIYLYAGWYSIILIKRRVPTTPAAQVLLFLHGIFSLVTTLIVQKVLIPDEPKPVESKIRTMIINVSDPKQKEIKFKLLRHLKDPPPYYEEISLDLSDPKQKEMYQELHSIIKK